MRSYVRQRERLLEYAASHIQHMQKALMEMNLQVHHVVADITGSTGMRIIRAILAGERDPAVLAALRDSRCRADVETIEKALGGNYRAEHLFALEQALALYNSYQEKVLACDARIETVLKELSLDRDRCTTPVPPPGRRMPSTANALDFDVRTALFKLLGKDVTRVNGLGPYLTLKLIAECGDDLSAWPSAKHFTSWLCLALHNKISGGKVLSSRTRRSGNRAASLLRLAAISVGRTDTALGAFYRRLAARIGKAKASLPRRARSPSCSITPCATGWSISTPVPWPTRLATVSGSSTTYNGAPRPSALPSSPWSRHLTMPFLRKIAVLFYNALRYGMEYIDPGALAYETSLP